MHETRALATLRQAFFKTVRFLSNEAHLKLWERLTNAGVCKTYSCRPYVEPIRGPQGVHAADEKCFG